MSLYQESNHHPEEAIRHKQGLIKQTKRALFQAIVDSYHLEHRMNTKSGILHYKSIPSHQAKQHKEDIDTARRQRIQAEQIILNSIDEIKQLNDEIKQLQAGSI